MEGLKGFAAQLCMRSYLGALLEDGGEMATYGALRHKQLNRAIVEGMRGKLAQYCWPSTILRQIWHFIVRKENCPVQYLVRRSPDVGEALREGTAFIAPLIVCLIIIHLSQSMLNSCIVPACAKGT